MEEILKSIDETVKQNDVVLYMKGTHTMPMCGFSGAVVMILKKLGIEFKDINVLDDEGIREAIKKYQNWPTIPQLYIKGEFIGGCDIVRAMNDSGELEQLLVKHNIKYNKAI